MSRSRSAAMLGRRAGAFLIDSAVAVVITLAVAFALAGVSLATSGSFPIVAAGVGASTLSTAWFVVYTWMQGRAGSIGMRALGLGLARDGVDAQLGFARALGRNIVWGLGATIVVGMFSPLFDASVWRRGWHDRASGAVMTDVAGRGTAPVEIADAAAPVEMAEDAVPAGASTSSVLPEAPILPSFDAPELQAWTNDLPSPSSSGSPRHDVGPISFVPGVTDPARATAAPAPVERSLSAPAIPAPLSDPLEQTRLNRERPVARLVWDDGSRQALYVRTVFGRNPTPETGAMVTPVRDETLSLSKTHFELTPDEDRGLWVIDRHSTNGVVVRRGAQRQPAVPGERTRVHTGDVLEFGDRHVVIEVAS